MGNYTGVGPLSVIQGATLNITCSSTGNPTPAAGNYTWTGVGITSNTGQILSIPNIQTSGQYTCTVTTTLTPSGGNPEQRANQSSINVQVLCK